ncbi:Hypothetical predicted protein [Xyrichtys novacula]|uniref:Secreted protein n=1 Tax=Xyrichtys novacula TaxID=13765 RepID=A0AAV1G076_XYRNO|nr:Hypothetical predicted protein [Xyrichtys novacula]
MKLTSSIETVTQVFIFLFFVCFLNKSESGVDRFGPWARPLSSQRTMCVAALFVYTAEICVYISVHNQGAAAPQLHCKNTQPPFTFNTRISQPRRLQDIPYILS